MSTKISLKQLGNDILSLLNRTGISSLEKDITSNTICGAAGSGSFFPQGQTFTEFAEKILRKDITPTITTSFSNVGLKEIGTVINGTTMKLIITNLNAVTVPINEIKFYVNNSLVNSQQYVPGKSNYQYIYPNQISENTSVKAELVFCTNQKVSENGNFTFAYASYYGTTALSSISDAEASYLVISFSKNVNNTKTFTWKNIALNDEKFLYLYPKTLGTLYSIKDGNGFEQIHGYTKYEINITSPVNGDVIPYYGYLLTDAVTGSGFTQIYS